MGTNCPNWCEYSPELLFHVFVNQFGVELEEILEIKTLRAQLLLSKPGILMSMYACMVLPELS